jgi:TRAP-type C4-dicarboxylate transport system permease small subunit
MKNSNINLSVKSLPELLNLIGRLISQYAVILFLILLVAVYGYVLMQINSLSSAKPSTSAISTQAQTVAIPHIDPTTIQQIQNLQNNSVSVQALFNQARTNPFQ